MNADLRAFLEKHVDKDSVLSFVRVGESRYYVLAASSNGRFRVVVNLSWALSEICGFDRAQRNGNWFVKIKRHEIFKAVRMFSTELLGEKHVMHHEIV